MWPILEPQILTLVAPYSFFVVNHLVLYHILEPASVMFVYVLFLSLSVFTTLCWPVPMPTSSSVTLTTVNRGYKWCILDSDVVESTKSESESLRSESESKTTELESESTGPESESTDFQFKSCRIRV